MPEMSAVETETDGRVGALLEDALLQMAEDQESRAALFEHDAGSGTNPLRSTRVSDIWDPSFTRSPDGSTL
jgi:hypothetical protein